MLFIKKVKSSGYVLASLASHLLLVIGLSRMSKWSSLAYVSSMRGSKWSAIY
ncbi:MAG: hypothetical protein PHD12_02635 [Methylotenera sp.]|nr:hypothetical protein [Methylotenera sp.]